MNQSIRTVILGACLLASAACPADAQRHRQTINNPVTQAVFRVYQEQLNQNPKNYDTLLRRANDYYHFDEFRKALDDVSRAIECTPSSQTDHLFREYLLRASIYNKTGRHELAIPDLQKACQLEPASQKALSMKAHTELETGKLVEAKADFLRLKRLNMRDPEATLGLARIAMQENNLGMANDYLEEAVALACQLLADVLGGASAYGFDAAGDYRWQEISSAGVWVAMLCRWVVLIVVFFME